MALVNTKLSFPITLNYVNKVPTSTVENPNFVIRNAGSSLSAPIFSGEPPIGSYTAINSLNGTTSPSTTSTSTHMAQYQFSFDLITSVERQLGIVIGFNTASKVAWLKANVESLVCNWFGFGSSLLGNKATVKYWVASGTPAWSTFERTNITGSIAKVSLTGITANNAIDSNGFAHFLAYADASNGTVASTINTDYVELIVTTSFEINTRTDWAISEAINPEDWNRIESNMSEVSTFLNAIQYANTTPSVVTNRTNISIDYLSSINRIENNLEALRVAFITPADYLPKKTWTVGKGFDYSDANRLEKNTKSLLDWGMLVYQSYRRCGALICGGGGLY